MGMFYCHGCEIYHDSKDGEYNVTNDGKEYCDEALPEDAVIECNNPKWHEVFAPPKPFRPQATTPTNPATLIQMGKL